MSEKPDPKRPRLLTPARAVLQITGFLAGTGLLVWIIKGALEEGQWSRLADAPRGWIAVLLGCTVVSAVTNGAIFWITIRPRRKLPFWDLQRLNVVANMLNYAPIRLGAITRVWYHLRVDRLPLLETTAWFAVVGIVLVVGVGACGCAILLRRDLDVSWFVVMIAAMIVGWLTLMAIARWPLIQSRARGLDRLVGDPFSIGGALTLRLVDLAAYSGRIAAAAVILHIDLAATQIVLLGLVALVGGLVPIGRVGFREFLVFTMAGELNLSSGEIEANLKQLALLESAGEALIFIPLGLIGLWWLQRKVREVRTTTDRIAPPDLTRRRS